MITVVLKSNQPCRNPFAPVSVDVAVEHISINQLHSQSRTLLSNLLSSIYHQGIIKHYKRNVKKFLFRVASDVVSCFTFPRRVNQLLPHPGYYWPFYWSQGKKVVWLSPYEKLSGGIVSLGNLYTVKGLALGQAQWLRLLGQEPQISRSIPSYNEIMLEHRTKREFPRSLIYVNECKSLAKKYDWDGLSTAVRSPLLYIYMKTWEQMQTFFCLLTHEMKLGLNGLVAPGVTVGHYSGCARSH
eukprot:scaffold725_cov133-Cylindrotheca_fusiformis.AAC.15